MSDKKYRASVGYSAEVGCEKRKAKMAALIYVPLISQEDGSTCPATNQSETYLQDKPNCIFH
jgi:alpha-D-ribose 1-methylphosphonate 5-triphosphate synthase subunit PhnG